MRASLITFGLLSVFGGLGLLASCTNMQEDCNFNGKMDCPENASGVGSGGSAGTVGDGGTGGTGAGGAAGNSGAAGSVGPICATNADCVTSECQTGSCNPTTHVCMFAPIPAGTAVAMPTPNDCARIECDGNGGTRVVAVANDLQDVSNDCMKCDGVTPAPVAKPDNTDCGQPSCNNEIALHGTCQSGSCNMIQTGCGSYHCDSKQCKTTCAADADCISTHYCDASASSCQHKKVQGNTCGDSNECSDNQNCVDKFCCTSECVGDCVSCELGGFRGVCATLPKGVVDSCDPGQACNDNGACVSLPTVKGVAQKAVGQYCSDSSECFNGKCFNHLCRIPEGSPCEQGYKYECSHNYCNKDGKCGKCSSNDDCKSGQCNIMDGNCKLVSGETCGIDEDCASENCDGNKCK